MKKCPSCGKKIAAQAHYCIYCSTKFEDAGETRVLDDLPEVSKPAKAPKEAVASSGGKLGLIVTVLSLVVIAIVLLLVFLEPDVLQAPADTVSTSTTVMTTTTRDAARDAWLQTFTGQWLDESSIGKGDIKKQGGHQLFVHEIVRDTVTFDLTSFKGGEKLTVAFLNNVSAVLEEDTLHFTFENDGLGHAGEGFMRFCETGVEMEVMIDGADALAEDEHSLAINAVFQRKSLPTSEGHDIRSLTTLDLVRAAAGEQTAEATADAAGDTTYTFGALKAITNADGAIKRLIVDYAAEQDKSKYCYDRVDGTMSYTTVKEYFGEAIHDYVEQPTDIRVLYYRTDETTSVTFTFDADDNLLIYIDYKL